MGEAVRSLKIRLLGDSSGLTDATESGGRGLSGLWKSFAGAAVATAAFDKIAGSIGAAFSQAKELNTAVNKAGTALGMNADQMKTMGQAAGQMYKDGFGESMAANVEAMKAVISDGLVPRDASASVQAKVAELVQGVASTIDVGAVDVADAAQKMMNTGIVHSAQEAMDAVTAGTNAGLGDLTEVFGEYSNNFAQLGLSGADAAGLMSQALKNGAKDADQAADSLREFTIRLSDGSALASGAFQTMGLDGQQMVADIAKGGPTAKAAFTKIMAGLNSIQDPLTKSTTGAALFGSMWEDSSGAMAAFDPSTAAAGLGQVAGSAQRATDAMKPDQIELFKRQMSALGVDVAQKVMPAFNALLSFLSAHSAQITTIAIPALIALGAVALVMGIQMAAAWVMALGPIELIAIAVAALAVLVIMNWDTIKNATLAAWNAVVGAVSAAVNAVVGAWNWAFSMASSIWHSVYGAVNSAIGGVVSAFDWVVRKGGELIGWFTGLPATLANALVDVGNIILAPYKWAFNAIAKAWNNSVGRLHFSIPKWVPGLGGNGFSMPTIPYLAKGGDIARAGAVVVGDAGPEVLNLPAGARVTPLSGSGAPAAGGGGDTYVFNIGGSVVSERQLIDIVRAGLNAKLRREGKDII